MALKGSVHVPQTAMASSIVLGRLKSVNSLQAMALKGRVSCGGSTGFLSKPRSDSAFLAVKPHLTKSVHGLHVLQQPFPMTMALKAPSCRNHVQCLYSSEHGLTQEETQVFLSDCLVTDHGCQRQQPTHINGQQIPDRVVTDHGNQRQQPTNINGQQILEDNVFLRPSAATLKLPVPDFKNTFKNTNGGKRIYFKGKFYDAKDPVFLRMRNENMINALERLHNMVDPPTTYDVRFGMQAREEDYPTFSNGINSRSDNNIV